MFQRFATRLATSTLRPTVNQFQISPFKLHQFTTRHFTTTIPRQQFQYSTQLSSTISTPSKSQLFQSNLKQSLTSISFTPQQSLFRSQIASFHIKLKVNRHKRDRIGYKSRPHHASMKRFWMTGSGRLMRFKSGMNHKRRRKTTAQLRRLSKRVEVPKTHYRRLTKMMMLRPYMQFPKGMSRPVNKFWQPPKDASKIKAKRWC